MDNQSKSKNPESNPVFVALYGFIATSILLTFDRLGVFEMLSRRGYATADSLAEELNLAPEALERALQGAASWGLVSRVDKKYGVAGDISTVLDPNGSEYHGPLLNHFRTNTVPLFNHLENALRDNKPQWLEFSSDKEKESHSFSHIFESDEQAESFHAAMWRLSYGPSEELVRKGLLSETRVLVDLGGGAGTFAIAAAKENLDLKATVFDLQEVMPYCEENINKENLQDRLNFIAGDFWEGQLPTADTYALGYILSDWTDEQAIRLLQRVKKALPEGGKVVVLERLLESDRSGPFMGLMQDLAMMLETGGMHRSEEHYRRLLMQAGFKQIEVYKSSGDKHAVVGVV